MNKCFFVARVAQAPERRSTSDGTSVTTFTIAVNRRFNREITDFITVVAWRGLADNCAKYLEKGQQVAVSGELQLRSWMDKEDRKHIVPEIIADDVEFLAKAGAKAEPQTRANNSGRAAQNNDIFADDGNNDIFGDAEEVILDDGELPF